MFHDIIEAIQKAGGKPFFVGGFVRDTLMGNPAKDFDIEVYDLHTQDLLSILRPFGDVNEVGSSFGVVKVRNPNKEEYDFASPRREIKNGVGYTGFEIEADPFMRPEDACSRRDYTINAMMMHPLTGYIDDYFDGRQDLANKILRATSARFAEDPLRVLRGVQFAGRFGFTMADSTVNMANRLASEFKYLTPERIFGEFQKLALKAVYPAMGMHVLHRTQWHKCFPALHEAVSREPGHYYSNMASLNRIAAYCTANNIEGEDRCVLFFATMVYGLMNGIEILENLNVFPDIIDRVRPMLKIDMPYTASEANVKELASHLCGKQIEAPLATIAMFLAVRRASRGQTKFQDVEKIAEKCGILNGKMKPLLNGGDLIKLGLKPGPTFGTLLKDAYDAQIEGLFGDKSSALEWVQVRLPSLVH